MHGPITNPGAHLGQTFGVGIRVGLCRAISSLRMSGQIVSYRDGETKGSKAGLSRRDRDVWHVCRKVSVLLRVLAMLSWKKMKMKARQVKLTF
ncbi:hypothetical protein DPMN_024590 [Dreissena polymorpha]|uniref:Uncharacterized protein n=1 Tax=Dreissena polymorpha TaxID=45954 RepID=A0A9D4LRP5_DREPO|nr:hypothetical protein DPMN_024590 [Dreissena polymorpha]